MPRSRYTIFLWVLAIFCAGRVFAQNSEIIQGRVLILVREDAVAQTASLFAPVLDTLRDPQALATSDDAAIRSLLVLPKNIKIQMLRPFAPQHSVANESLREHLNEILFYKKGSQSIRIAETEEIARLRAAEGKLARWFELQYEGNLNPEAIAATLKKSEAVEAAEPRYHRYPLFTPNDPMFKDQYAPELMNAPKAWDIIKGDSSTIVADIDVGTDWTHPDLENAIYINYGETGLDSSGYDKRSNGIDDDGDGFVDDWHGWDFAGRTGIAPDNNPTTPQSHGTHTAGIMAASGNNGIGVAGVAFGVKLMALKASDDAGQSIDFGYDAMVYAADMGAVVANNSWGGSSRSMIEQDIIDYVNAKNCSVVAASGNAGLFQDFFPASYNHVLSACANDPNGTIASYSNYGPHVDVSAPGTLVLSTVPGGGYESLVGTSMASPDAAGGLALVRQKFPALSADQAMERLRATSDPVLTGDNKNFYVGHGLVNIYRAVSKDTVYSARIEQTDILDDNGNNILEPGEGGNIVLHVRNYLSPLEKLSAKLEIVTGSENVSFNTNTVDFGKANTLELVQNFAGSFRVTASDSVPSNYHVLVRVTFGDATAGYGPDYDYFSFIVNPAYTDLDANNLLVTFDSKGSIGYNDSPDNNEGNGFQWRKAPATVSPKGKSVLWQAGLMAAIDPLHVVASAPTADESQPHDFNILQPIRPVSPADKPNAAQELFTAFDDSNATAANEVGITVSQKNYAITKGAAADAVVIHYVLHKRPTESGIQPTDSTSIALFMDWDIGFSGANNTAYLSTDNVTGITRRLEDNYPFVGVRLISAIPKGATLQCYALDNDGSNGSVSTYQGFGTWEKWQTMTIFRHDAGPGDVSMIYGLKNVPMASSDSIELTYIIALGTDEAQTIAAIDKARDEYYGITKVAISDAFAILEANAKPNPFSHSLHLNWGAADDAPSTIELSDVLGRVVYKTYIKGNFINLSTLDLPGGEYFVRITEPTGIHTVRVVCVP
jgi:hypothetical protein